MKCLVLIGAIVLLSCAQARGQTTQPVAEDPWPQAVEQFAAAMLEGQSDAYRSMLADNASVGAFGGTAGSEEAARLLARASVCGPIGVHAYVHPPLVMAADLMADCKNTELPESIRQRMIPQDDAAMQRANATAAQWMSESLQAAAGDRVGVIVLFEPADATRLSRGLSGSSSAGELLFVLVRAHPSAAAANSGPQSAVPRIDRVVYGNPLMANASIDP